MGCMAYLLLTFALWTQPQGEFCLLAAKEMAVGYVFSRAMSAAAVVTFPCAKIVVWHTAFPALRKRIVCGSFPFSLHLCAQSALC